MEQEKKNLRNRFLDQYMKIKFHIKVLALT